MVNATREAHRRQNKTTLSLVWGAGQRGQYGDSWTVQCSNPDRGKWSSVPQKRPDLLCSPPSLLFYTYGGTFPRLKRSGHEYDKSSPSSVQLKNEWRYTSATSRCVHGVDGDTFTLTLFWECYDVRNYTTADSAYIYRVFHDFRA